MVCGRRRAFNRIVTMTPRPEGGHVVLETARNWPSTCQRHEAGSVVAVLAVSQRLIVFFWRTVIQPGPWARYLLAKQFPVTF